jgi:hypothetical protein
MSVGRDYAGIGLEDLRFGAIVYLIRSNLPLRTRFL